WAGDDEAARREDSSLGGPVEPDNRALVGQVLDGTEVRLQRSLFRRHLPLGLVHIPERAVSALTGIPAQHVEWIKAVEYRGVQALPIGIARTGLANRQRRQTCAGRRRAVVVGGWRLIQRRRVRDMLDRGSHRIRRLERRVAEWLAALETIRLL